MVALATESREKYDPEVNTVFKSVFDSMLVFFRGSSPSRLLFKHQQLNASPYGFASVYRQCSCVITVCTRKSPVCHKVCNFNKIYCPFSRCNINKDNVHKSIIL